MPESRSALFNQLQQDILQLQGYKSNLAGNAVTLGLGPMLAAFPNHSFPIAAVHELICGGVEDAAATGGFLAGLIGGLMRSDGAAIWIGRSPTIFPPALNYFGIKPERVIFIDLQQEKDVLWAMEEALKCRGLAAVVGEIKELGFTASRRLQLAVEASRVTGFILRHQPRNLGANACVARWQVRSIPSEAVDGLPGIGFPRWQVDLAKVRNGKPGSWPVSWAAGRFAFATPKMAILPQVLKKKTG